MTATSSERLPRWSHGLERLVFPLSARALGAFRIALGLGFLWIVRSVELDSVQPAVQRHYGALDFDFIHRLAASPEACRLLERAIAAAAALFTIGLATRLAYAAVVAGFFLWTLVTLEQSGAHDWGLPLVTLIGLLTVPWQAGLSIDNWIARRRGRAVPPDARSRAYGFAIWWPGLTVGAALFAAAYTKLTYAGPAWITSGAVKYHFVVDYANAAVDWGLWVASHHPAAVLFSLAAIAIEGGVILNVFARTTAQRLAAGAVAASLFLGLYLFQGIFWEQWLVLLLAFLPWDSLARTRIAPAAAVGALRPMQLAAAVVFVATQALATVMAVEKEPLISNFPMYSSTWPSTEAFDRDMDWRFTRIVDVRADGSDAMDAFTRLADDNRNLLTRTAERLGRREAQVSLVTARRAPLCEEYARRNGSIPEQLVIGLERSGFDWHAGRFRPYSPVPTAPVPLAKLCS